MTHDKQKIYYFNQLQKYCEDNDFSGWDPYDGLNSKIFNFFGLNNFKFTRLAWIQLFKRSPINLRTITLVPKEHNPKGIALFLTGYCNLYNAEPKDETLKKIAYLADILIKNQTLGFSGACWGYNFDWQNRAFFLPKGTPTVVATSFAARALMDAYDITKNEFYLDTAISSCQFILQDLNRTEKKDGFIFSYSPFDHTRVYNASLLGSYLLARANSYKLIQDISEAIDNSIKPCLSAQKSDGAWEYGELPIQNWVDSFHTGYNLECLNGILLYTNNQSVKPHIELGLKYYLNNFFLPDGTPKYYNDKTYPIDIHSPAQFIVTLSRLGKLEENDALVSKILDWTNQNMRSSKGYYYYQKKPWFTSKTPYMRWAQAWMFYGQSFMK